MDTVGLVGYDVVAVPVQDRIEGEELRGLKAPEVGETPACVTRVGDVDGITVGHPSGVRPHRGGDYGGKRGGGEDDGVGLHDVHNSGSVVMQ